VKVYTDIEQGSQEWFDLRCGKATASEFSCVLAKGQGKTRASYLRRVVAEILTGKPVETFRNAHTDRGQEQEPMARWSYELITGNSVERVAFIEHDKLAAGCSPDGFVLGRSRGAEIKCVIPTVQVETIDAGGYPSEHQAQVQGSMWITECGSWDFCSYCPAMPEGRLRTYIFTVERDEEYIRKWIEPEVRRFLDDVNRTVDRLLGREQDIEGALRASLKEGVPA
jgi:hypothetical protein